jgi:hypothetical protein
VVWIQGLPVKYNQVRVFLVWPNGLSIVSENSDT